jgi:F-type H+-transporting ATPase subunit a
LKIFAFCFTFFIYILLSNWLGILPGFGSIYVKHYEEKIHLLRSAYSDLNMTLALGLISVIGANLLGLIKLKFDFVKKFMSPIGLMELFSEVSKILSFSLRLFGNILAGEVLILSINLLIPFLVPTPFLFLEIFVGFIQALIFFILTSIFLKVAISHH